jgi:hypothetical protein
MGIGDLDQIGRAQSRMEDGASALHLSKAAREPNRNGASQLLTLVNSSQPVIWQAAPAMAMKRDDMRVAHEQAR